MTAPSTELPPADNADYRNAIAQPFTDPGVPEGAQVTYPHTRQDAEATRLVDHAASIATLDAASNQERARLARHQTLVAEGDISSLPTDVRPTVTVPRNEAADGQAEDAADAVPDDKWDSFVKTPEAPVDTRRGRARDKIMSILRRNRG